MTVDEPEDLTRPLALLVEDDETLLTAKRELFHAVGLRTFGARSLNDASRELSRRADIDLIIVDINLDAADASDRSGVTFARNVREARPELPVVGYSAYFSEEDLTGEERRLFRNYLPKGRMGPAELLSRFASWATLADRHRQSRLRAADPSRLRHIDAYDIPTDSARRLIDEFNSTAALLVLAPIIKILQIPDPTLSCLLRLIRCLDHAVHEREAVCTAVLIVPTPNSLMRLGKPFVTPKERVSIGEEDKISTLAQLVHGLEGSIVAVPSGEVLGGVLYPAATESPTDFLPARYWKAAAAAKRSGGLLVLFLGGGRTEVFYAGRRVISHRAGMWRLEPEDVAGQLEGLALRHEVRPNVLSAVIRIATIMADEGAGGLFAIGAVDAVLSMADAPSEQLIGWTASNVVAEDLRPAIALARQDGAVLVSQTGEIVRGMLFLHPPREIVAEQEAQRGTRHDTAAKVSAASNAITVAVSVDGTISVYSRGRRLIRLFG